MNFRKVNNLTGWAVCLVACLVYVFTAEATASFWDTGEFIASAYKLQLPHPPGAPLFILIGRLFIVLFGGGNPAFAVNLMSALASGFTILFLFWTITHLGRKLIVGNIDEPDMPQTWTIMGAGLVGSLAYTFSDSFWYSAVEGEVYALSSFFTALVFWAMLKWERASDLAANDRPAQLRADRWIIFIFFMMGLSIGVHLLNLLTIPALVMIYYFKRFDYSRKGAIFAFIIGCVITGVVQVAAIQWTVRLAGRFDIWFVNGMDLPFYSGFILFFVLLSAAIWWGLRVARRNGWGFLRLGLWCFTFLMIGYSTYVTTLIRSSANPAIDMNNVDNPMSLVYYLGREQYGEAPLVYGPHFQAQITGEKEGKMRYAKGENEYIELGPDKEYEYDSEDLQLFPRIWEGNDPDRAEFYTSWLDLDQIAARELSIVTNVTEGSVQTESQAGRPETYTIPQDFTIKARRGQVLRPGDAVAVQDPSYADNIQWFMTYQMGFMYWRYFMWNFAGKQNDLQGFGNKRDGNWISGFSFIDNARLGDQSMMPESLRDNKANNKLYLLPFILGIFGAVFHFLKARKDWIVTFLLFFFTGLAIVLYLNQPGTQPRERDYAFVGSFYAFAIWIGLAVIGLVRMGREREDKQSLINTLVYSSLAAFVLALLSNTTSTFSGAFISSLLTAVVTGAVLAAFIFIVRAVSGRDYKVPALLATALCLTAPVLMAAEEWNDHDRSQKTLAPSQARNYLESCAPNAILFTFGDNDTYPLWYAQEVEGVRPDIRIINTSLLGIDWYVNQLRYKVNESAPIDVIWPADKVRGLQYITFQPRGQQDRFYDLYDVMKNVIGQQPTITSFPVKRFTVPVNAAAAQQTGLANATDSLFSELRFEISEGKNFLTLDQLTMLNIIAANGWTRPIYFTSPSGPHTSDLGLGNYLRKEGLSYRLVPVQNRFPQQNWVVDQAMRQVGLGGTGIRDNNTEKMYQTLMTKFQSGNANIFGVYYDEENRRHLLAIRSTFGELAGNMADSGRKAEAANLLQKAESLIDPRNLPYAMASRYNSHNQTALLYLEAAYKAGNTALAGKLRQSIQKDLQDQKKYYDYLRNERDDLYQSLIIEDQINSALFQVFETLEKTYGQAGGTPVENVSPAAPGADTTQPR